MTTPRSSLPVCGLLALSLALTTFIPTPNAEAVLIAYDGFDSYATDGNLAGNTGGSGWAASAWTSLSGFNDVIDDDGAGSDGGLDYTSGSVTIDGGAKTMARLAGAGSSANADNYIGRTFTSTSSTEVWMSFLYEPGTVGGTGSSDFLTFYLSDAIGETQSGAALINHGNTGGDKVGVRANPTVVNAALSDYFTATPTTGVTYLVVLRISFDGTSSVANDTYDLVELWLNPTSDVLGTADALFDADMQMSSLSYFGMRVNGLATSDTFKMDELTIGTTVYDVVLVPEPSLGTLLGVGVFGMLFLRRRSKTGRNK